MYALGGTVTAQTNRTTEGEPMSRALEQTLVKYTDVLKASLTGGEQDIRAALARLDESEASRLRNTLYAVSELAEAHRKSLRRARGRM